MITQPTKDKLVTAMREHYRLDQIQKGSWWYQDEQRGCHIACCGEAFGLPPRQPNWEALSKVTGIDEWLLRLSEAIFEGLPVDQAAEFSVQFCEQLPVNVDFNIIRPAIEIARMERLKGQQNDSIYKNNDKINRVLDKVIDYWNNPTDETRKAAESACSEESSVQLSVCSVASATWSVASAAWSVASAKLSLACSRESSACSASWAAWSTEQSAARLVAWIDEKDALLTAFNQHN